MQDVAHTNVRFVTRFDPDGSYFTDFRSTDDSGKVERTWERGRWSVIGDTTVRHQAEETSNGKPKLHDSVYDYRIEELATEFLRWRHPRPDAEAYTLRRVDSSAKP